MNLFEKLVIATLITMTLAVSATHAASVPTINSAASDLQETVSTTQDLMAEAANADHCNSIVEKAEITSESIQADLYDQCEDQAY